MSWSLCQFHQKGVGSRSKKLEHEPFGLTIQIGQLVNINFNVLFFPFSFWILEFQGAICWSVEMDVVKKKANILKHGACFSSNIFACFFGLLGLGCSSGFAYLFSLFTSYN